MRDYASKEGEMKNADSLVEELFMFTYELLQLIASCSCPIINYVSFLCSLCKCNHSSTRKIKSYCMSLNEKKSFSVILVKTIFYVCHEEEEEKACRKTWAGKQNVLKNL
jgi:hypothetical protein